VVYQVLHHLQSPASFPESRCPYCLLCTVGRCGHLYNLGFFERVPQLHPREEVLGSLGAGLLPEFRGSLVLQREREHGYRSHHINPSDARSFPAAASEEAKDSCHGDLRRGCHVGSLRLMIMMMRDLPKLTRYRLVPVSRVFSALPACTQSQ